MIEVTSESLRDFQLCKYLYKAKHIDKIHMKEHLAKREMLPYQLEEAIDKTIKYFYFESMANGVPSYKTLLWKFEKQWLKDKTVEEIISDRDAPYKNVHHFTTEGIRVIDRFYKLNYKNPGKVLNISESYVLPIGEGLTASGQIDIVIEKDGIIILPYYTFRGKQSYKPGAEKYFKIILDALAFRRMSGKRERSAEITFLKTGFTTDNMVINDLMVRQLKDITEEIKECKRYYPSNNNYWCKNCTMEKYCSTW